MTEILENKQKEINNNLDNQGLKQNELVTSIDQKNFLDTALGKVINTAVDMGLRLALPDFIENQIIEVKDILIRGGLKEGISKAVDSAMELGKSVTGIFTGKFENVSQAQNAIKNGGIIDGISNALDSAISFTTKKGLIPYNVANMIRKGKDVILDNVSNNIETEFVSQLDNIEKLGKYENNWREYYNSKNFEGMEREYQKIKDRLKETIPLENTLRQARQIENLHLLIKNNGYDFNLTSEQLELAGILTN